MAKQALTINTLAATVITPSEVSQFSLDDAAPNIISVGDYLMFNEKGVVTGGRLDNTIAVSGLQINRRDITRWSIPMPNTQVAENMFASSSLEEFDASLDSLQKARYMFNNNKNLRLFKTTSLANARDMENFLQGCINLSMEVWEYDLPKLTNGWSAFIQCPFKVWRGNLDKLSNGRGMFSGCNKLAVFEVSVPSLSTGDNFLNGAVLNKESAVRVLTTIPAYTSGTHNLTIGIHVDHQSDEEVLVAIADAKDNKGWTVSVQWNGTATASTYALRPTQPLPIYAKAVQDEHGEYADANSTVYMIDWGHEIHSPDDKTPEELGYTMFDSLEAALLEWELTERIDPEYA